MAPLEVEMVFHTWVFSSVPPALWLLRVAGKIQAFLLFIFQKNTHVGEMWKLAHIKKKYKIKRFLFNSFRIWKKYAKQGFPLKRGCWDCLAWHQLGELGWEWHCKACGTKEVWVALLFNNFIPNGVELVKIFHWFFFFLSSMCGFVWYAGNCYYCLKSKPWSRGLA